MGFEESSDEEDGGRERGRRREPDEKLKATVASLTQSALEWKLRRQQSSGSSKHASRNNSAANLHHGGGAPAHTMHGWISAVLFFKKKELKEPLIDSNVWNS